MLFRFVNNALTSVVDVFPSEKCRIFHNAISVSSGYLEVCTQPVIEFYLQHQKKESPKTLHCSGRTFMRGILEPDKLNSITHVVSCCCISLFYDI